MPVESLFLAVLLGVPTITILIFLSQHKGQKSPASSATSPKNQMPTLPSLEDQKEKNYELMHDAIKQAQQMLSEAETEQVKMAADTRSELKKFEEGVQREFSEADDDYRKNLNQAINNFTEQLKKTEQNYASLVESLKTQSDRVHMDSLNIVKQEVNKLFVNFEQNLSEFLTETEQKSTQSIDLELQATRQLIETYKKQQLQIVDENIVAMLERTLSLVLPKKLSLDDQVDLVLEALEKAKAEKFIG